MIYLCLFDIHTTTSSALIINKCGDGMLKKQPVYENGEMKNETSNKWEKNEIKDSIGKNEGTSGETANILEDVELSKDRLSDQGSDYIVESEVGNNTDKDEMNGAADTTTKTTLINEKNASDKANSVADVQEEVIQYADTGT